MLSSPCSQMCSSISESSTAGEGAPQQQETNEKQASNPSCLQSVTGKDICCREIQPLETRAAGAGINVAVNMLFTFIIGQCFTTMLCSMRYGVFLFFAGANAHGLIAHARHHLTFQKCDQCEVCHTCGHAARGHVQAGLGLYIPEESRMSTSCLAKRRESRRL